MLNWINYPQTWKVLSLFVLKVISIFLVFIVKRVEKCHKMHSISSSHFHQNMCFNIGYKIKQGKLVLVKEYEGEEENQGLLFIELQRWKREKHIEWRRCPTFTHFHPLILFYFCYCNHIICLIFTNLKKRRMKGYKVHVSADASISI